MAKRFIDYKCKSYIFNNCSDFLSLINIAKKQHNARIYCEEYGVVSFTMKHWRNDIPSFAELYRKYGCNRDYKIEGYEPAKLWRECLKILNANHHRRERLQARITDMLSEPCLFLTLTFSDDAIASTTPKQRRVAVSRFLKSHNCKYVANIDFGVDERYTQREHYHAIIQCSKIDTAKWSNKYGCAFAEHVRVKNSAKLSKYIAKLTNHAIKESTKRSALIYSR